MNRVKLWVRLLVLRFRLWLIQSEWGTGWGKRPFTPEQLWQIACVTDPVLLENVSNRTLQATDVTVRFQHAGQIFDWLSYVSGRLRRLESLEDSHMYPLQDRYIVDLDTFLVNSHRGSISLMAFQSALMLRLDELCTAFESVNDQGLKNHYQRKLQWLLPDIFNVQEGALRASMANV